jgi:hypothetical protein
MAIDASIGWFVSSEEDVAQLDKFVPSFAKLMLSFYKIEHVVLARKCCLPLVDQVVSLHLPKGLGAMDFGAGGLVEDLLEVFPVRRMVIHPWMEDLGEIVEKVLSLEKYALMLEIFSLGKKRGLFELIADFGKELRTPYLGLCVDFSHLPKEILSGYFLMALNPYLKMIHLSCVKDGVPHSPVWADQTILAGFRMLLHNVPNLRLEEVALEYGKDHISALENQYYWLHDYVVSARRRYERSV